MRKLRTEGQHTEVIVRDYPGEGGACHWYVVKAKEGDALTVIDFQEGPIKEKGVNGCQNEDLLAIGIDRLEHFQKGPFPCVENDGAIYQIKNALMFLQERTQDRKKRGVEGENKK